MSVRSFLIAVVIFVTTGVLRSQNLVSNPSFEFFYNDYLLCTPSQGGGDFNNVMDKWSSASAASPDLHTLYVLPSCWSYANPYFALSSPTECHYIGKQQPHTGNAMVGIITKVKQSGNISGNYKEYIQNELIAQMEQGRFYAVSFYISLADYSFGATNNMGVYFSTDKKNYHTNQYLNLIPHIEFSKVITDTANWEKLQDTIIAQDAWEYMIIGNFRSNAANTERINGGICIEYYYYIDDVSVEVIPLQIIGDSIICKGETITLTGKNTQNFKWAEQSNPETIISTDSLLIVSPATNTTYLLCGLNDTAYFHVTVLPRPVLTSIDTCEFNWAVVQLSAEDGTPPYSFQWSNGSIGAFQPKVNDGAHVIIVSDTNQCKDTITVTTTCVEQGSIINIPQAFTPNGDGRNDFLPIFGDVGIISSYEFSIFNRWGNLVYSINDLSQISTGDLTKGWEGTYKGEKQETGVYVYSLQVEFVNGKKRLLSGNVMLIR